MSDTPNAVRHLPSRFAGERAWQACAAGAHVGHVAVFDRAEHSVEKS